MENQYIKQRFDDLHWIIHFNAPVPLSIKLTAFSLTWALYCIQIDYFLLSLFVVRVLKVDHSLKQILLYSQLIDSQEIE